MSKKKKKLGCDFKTQRENFRQLMLISRKTNIKNNWKKYQVPLFPIKSERCRVGWIVLSFMFWFFSHTNEIEFFDLAVVVYKRWKWSKISGIGYNEFEANLMRVRRQGSSCKNYSDIYIYRNNVNNCSKINLPFRNSQSAIYKFLLFSAAKRFFGVFFLQCIINLTQIRKNISKGIFTWCVPELSIQTKIKPALKINRFTQFINFIV